MVAPTAGMRFYGYCTVLVSEDGTVWQHSRPTQRKEVAEACKTDWSRTGLVGLKAEIRELFERTPAKPEYASKYVIEQHAKELARAAALPPGTCHACEGAGEQGGQFCGGFWTCEACGGSGKAAT